MPQTVVVPEIFAVRVLVETDTYFDALQPAAFVAVTVYPPAPTVIAAVVAALLHL